MLRHVTHYYFINFVKGLSPRVSEAHRGYTSLHSSLTLSVFNKAHFFDQVCYSLIMKTLGLY